MAQRSNIVINDNQTTPVSHTFNPNSGDGNTPGVSLIAYEDRAGGIQVGFNVISIATRKPTKGLKNNKISIVIKRPTLEVLSNSSSGLTPAPSVAYDCLFRGEFILPERSDLQSRKDILAYAKNLLGHSSIVSAVHDLESPW